MVFGEAFAEEGGLNRAGNEWGFDRLRKLRVFVDACVCMHVYNALCAHIHVYICVYKLEKDLRQHHQEHHLPLLRQDLSLA